MEDVRQRFRRMVEDDRKEGRLRSLASYQRLFHGHSDLIAEEYRRVGAEGAPTPPRRVEPPGSTDSILERIPRGDELHREGEIARGGMGAIEKVRDDVLRRDLAMKVMLPEREDEAMYIHRFLEEAQITAQLDHPGVVPVHQLGRDAEGRLFFTMKLVKGRTLSEIFELVRERKRNWSNTRCVELFIRICETLAFAHEKGVVHRDLKPANIMVGDFGELYVMDWGLAKVLGDRAEPETAKTPTPTPRTLVNTVRSAESEGGGPSPTATVAGDVLGTPAYMPLEQALGSELDARSDVYAIGAMLYELLVGHAPYMDRQRAPRDIVVAVVAGPPPPVRKAAPGMPAEIGAICDKAMARDPADRYQTAGELAQELRNFIEGRVVRAHRTGALVELRKWVFRNKALAAAVAVAFALLVAGLLSNRALYLDAVRESDRAQREAYRAGIAAAAAQIESGDLIQAAARLDSLPASLRGWEWRHLKSRVNPALAHVPFRVAAFDWRTGRVLGGDAERRLLAYDLATGTVTELLKGVEVRTNRRWVSFDGRYCYVPEGVLDRHTGRIVAPPGGEFADGRPWVVRDGRALDLETGKEVPPDAATALGEKLMADRVNVQSTFASPDRTKVILLRDDTLTLFDAETGAQIGETLVGRGMFLCRAWSPDGRLLAVGGWGPRVLVIDTATGELRRRLDAASVGRVAFSADGRLLATDSNLGSRVWFLGTGDEPRVLRGHHSYVYPVGFSPDGQRLVSGGWDGHVKQEGSLRLWDVASGAPIVATSRTETLWWAAFAADGRLLTAPRDRLGTRILDGDTLEELARLPYSERFAVSPDGSRAVIGYGSRWNVIDLATGGVVLALPEGNRGPPAWRGGWIAQGLVVNNRTGALELRDAERPERAIVIPDTVPVGAIDIDPRGRRVVIGGTSDAAAVYDIGTKARLAELRGHGREVLCVRFAPDGQRIFVGSRDGNIHVWDATSYDEIVQLRGHDAYVFALDFSSDGETLVSSSGDGTVRIWETKPLAARQHAVLEREKLVAELTPRVTALFEELPDAKAVVARLRAEPDGRRREVALQLALAEAVARRKE